MAYLSLYRRRRPLTFADMIGQEHITRTLCNALLNERLAHAYLFSGPRGTGKTTAAKILARAMNCQEYPTAEPCGRCIPCKNIAAGVSIDVIEMDAASNRGIDEIRDLRERSRFAGGESRFKVYIIDEAHMLTPEACNAFLKTLEEPPADVVFILATTDPSRLPATIVSRCQRFDFHLLTAAQIRKRLDQILAEEEWQAEDEALNLISRLADGSLRDALGILEQCAAYGEEKISAEHVRIVTGATKADLTEALVKAVIENDLDAGLEVIGQVVYSGRDLNLFLRDLTFIFSRLLLSGKNDYNNRDKRSHQELFDVICRYRDNVEKPQLLEAVELLHEAGGELRHAHFPQYILEVTMIRLIRRLHGRLKPAPALHMEDFIDQQKEETEFKKEITAKPKVKEPEGEVKILDSKADLKSVPAEDRAGMKPEQDENEEDSAAGDQPECRLSLLQQAWPRLIDELKKRQKSTAAWLEPAVLKECRGHLVVLTYDPLFQIHQERLMSDSHRKQVEKLLSSFCRDEIKIKAVVETGGQSKPIKHEAGLQPNRAPEDSEPKAGPEPVINQNIDHGKEEKGPTIEEAQELFGGRIIDTD